jgi:2-polyprenyl-3-methyl-5-hydroxy-6-metoxy-1,4-benzoquinol methylase
MPIADPGYIYHDYDRADPPHQPLYLDIILQSLRSRSDIVRVLDAGCGDGNFAASLADAGFDMFGIDLSAGGIAKAHREHPNIRFVQGSVYDDLKSLFGIDGFDAIVAIEVIEHLYSPEQFVRRAYGFHVVSRDIEIIPRDPVFHFEA